MPRKSRKPLAFYKLLDATRAPIFVLDAQRRIAFCNRACLEWTGTEADELLGR